MDDEISENKDNEMRVVVVE